MEKAGLVLTAVASLLVVAGLSVAEPAAAPAGSSAAAGQILPPPPAGPFDDEVGIVGPREADRLTAALAGFDQRTGIRFVVAVLPEIPGGDLEAGVDRLYEHWGIGQASGDRGVLFAVFPRQQRYRLEVGPGLEPVLPEAVADRIIRHMQQLPADAAGERLQYVITQVAARVAPDDQLGRGIPGARPRQPGGGNGRGGRGGLLIALFTFFLFVVFALGWRRRVRMRDR